MYLLRLEPPSHYYPPSHPSRLSQRTDRALCLTSYQFYTSQCIYFNASLSSCHTLSSPLMCASSFLSLFVIKCSIRIHGVSQVALVVKKKKKIPPSMQVRDARSIPGLGKSPGESNGNPLEYSCLENPLGRSSWAGYSPCSCKELDPLSV